MKRIGIHELFTKMALDVAQRSTCARVSWGCYCKRSKSNINGVEWSTSRSRALL